MDISSMNSATIFLATVLVIAVFAIINKTLSSKSARPVLIKDHVRISRGHIRLVLLPHFSFLFFFSPFRTTGYIMS